MKGCCCRAATPIPYLRQKNALPSDDLRTMRRQALSAEPLSEYKICVDKTERLELVPRYQISNLIAYRFSRALGFTTVVARFGINTSRKGAEMLKFFSLAFARTPQPADPDATITRKTMRDIVSTRSHGNVRLQSGRYYTKADIDAEYEAVRGTELTA